jgi:hypothetical protein
MPVDPGKEYDYQKDECKDDEYPASHGQMHSHGSGYFWPVRSIAYTTR